MIRTGMQLPTQSTAGLCGAICQKKSPIQRPSPACFDIFIASLPDLAPLLSPNQAPQSYSAYLPDQHLASQFTTPSAEAARLSLLFVFVLFLTSFHPDNLAFMLTVLLIISFSFRIVHRSQLPHIILTRNLQLLPLMHCYKIPRFSLCPDWLAAFRMRGSISEKLASKSVVPGLRPVTIYQSTRLNF